MSNPFCSVLAEPLSGSRLGRGVSVEVLSLCVCVSEVKREEGKEREQHYESEF